jgi:hypothetical protein
MSNYFDMKMFYKTIELYATEYVVMTTFDIGYSA